MALSDEIRDAIRQSLREHFTPRHVPDEIIQVQEIPYTLTGKKMETPVKKLLMGLPAGRSANPDAMQNPESLDYFVDFAAALRDRFPIRQLA